MVVSNIENSGQKHTKKHIQGYPFLISPGPAVAILSEPDYKTVKSAEETIPQRLRVDTRTGSYHDMSSNQPDNVRGLVAAAALEVNQHIPLPLKAVQEIPKKEIKLQEGSNSDKDDTVEEGKLLVGKDEQLENDDEFDISDYVVGSNDNIVSCICGNNNLEDEDDDEEAEEENKLDSVLKDDNSTVKTEGDDSKKDIAAEENDDAEVESVSNDVFWLQCDHCNRWVHGKCYGHKDNSSVNNTNFHCHVCRPEDHALVIKKFKTALEKSNAGGSNKKTNEKRTRRQKETKKVKNEKKANGSENNKPETTEEVVVDEYAVDDTIKRVRLKHIKDMYGNIYYPIEKNEYAEPYLENFLRLRSKKDSAKPWVVNVDLSDFKNSKLDVKSPPSKSGEKFTGIPSLFVISKEFHSSGALLHEVLGQIGDQKNYINDPKNQYRLLGVCKPKVAFHTKWPVYIDMRLVGNNVRYMRRSCHPNCEIVTATKQGEETPTFYLRALKDISVNEELTLSWQWDVNHPMWKITPGEHQLKYDKNHLKKAFEDDPNNTGLAFNWLLPFELDDISEPERYFLIYCVDTLLTMADCACPNHKRCQLRTVKKYYTSLLKLKKSMSLATMRYKTYDLLNQYKLQEPKQSSILNDLKMKEESRYENRFNDYSSFVSIKRKLEEEDLKARGQEKPSDTFAYGEKSSQEVTNGSSYLPSPLSPKQYKLELIAQYKLQDALKNNPNIKNKKQKTLESTIPKLANLFQKSKNPNVLIKPEKLSLLKKFLEIRYNSDGGEQNKKDLSKPEPDSQKLLIQHLMKGEGTLLADDGALRKPNMTEKLDDTEAGSNQTKLNSSSSASTANEITNKSTITTGNTAANGENGLKTSLNATSSGGPSDSVSQTKKKMSFADYRKKSKPS